MGFPITSIIIMLILAAGMFYGQKQYKKNNAEWGKLVTIICGFSVIGTALYTNLCSSGFDSAAFETERQFQRIQMQYLAQNMAKNYSGNGNCLFIHDPTDEKGREFLDSMLEAFKTGFGDKLIAIYPVPISTLPDMNEPETEEMMMEMYEDANAEKFNEVIDKNRNCDIIIFYTSLPASEEELYKLDPFIMIEDDDNPGEWIRDPEKKYPSVGVYNGYVGNLAEFVEEGLIKAITLWKNKPDTKDKSIPDDLKEAFEKRYIIVTGGNIEALKKSSPKMFPKEIEEE